MLRRCVRRFGKPKGTEMSRSIAYKTGWNDVHYGAFNWAGNSDRWAIMDDWLREMRSTAKTSCRDKQYAAGVVDFVNRWESTGKLPRRYSYQQPEALESLLKKGVVKRRKPITKVALHYTNKFPVDTQVDLEEAVASILFDKFGMNEDNAKHAADILVMRVVQTVAPHYIKGRKK